MRPQIGGTWLVGGTEPECDDLQWIDDPDNYDEYPTVEQFEVSMMRVARRVPEFGVPHRPVGLAALYDVSEDWVPLYDKSDLPGFFMSEPSLLLNGSADCKVPYCLTSSPV